MFAVRGIGGYISRKVYISSPFRPFSGAVDIIVVEQPDGSLKSSPWYVSFGKFQTDGLVRINVNGDDADFHMTLGNNGEAYFVREGDSSEEDESERYLSSGDEVDNLKAEIWRNKSKSCNFDAGGPDLISELEVNDSKIIARNGSGRGRMFGFFGRRSMKENSRRLVSDDEGDRENSLERAEFAADLLEVRWTTNLSPGKKSPREPFSIPPVVAAENNGIVGDSPGVDASIVNDDQKEMLESSVTSDDYAASDAPDCQITAALACSTNPGDLVEVVTVKETYIGDADGSLSKDSNSTGDCSVVTASIAQIACTAVSEQSVDGSSSATGLKCDNIEEVGIGIEVLSPLSSDTVENSMTSMDNSIGQGNERLLIADGPLVELKDRLPVSSKLQLTVPTSEMVKKEEDSLDIVASCNGNDGASSDAAEALATVDVDTESSADDRSRSTACLTDEEFLENCSQERSTNLAQSETSEDEQFSFSDLDGPNLKEREQSGDISTDSGKKWNQDSPDSVETSQSFVTAFEPGHASENIVHDNLCIVYQSPRAKSNGVSSPITIARSCRDPDEQLFGPAVESLPNLLSTSDTIHPHVVAQPLSRSFDSNFVAVNVVTDNVQAELDSKLQRGAQMQLTAESALVPEEIKKIVSDPAVEVSLCRHLLYEGMGYEAAAAAFDTEKLDSDKFHSLGPDVVKNEKLVVRIGGLYFPWEAAVPIACAIGSEGGEQILEPKGMIAVGQVEITGEGTPQQYMNSRNGSWRWPFSFKKSNSMRSGTFEPPSEHHIVKDGNTAVVEAKVMRKKIRVKTPTSEQLKSLHLKEGKNVVTFKFSTASLGNQQIDARIFLWKWNTRIVISDVDGTITKSDVLGQFMPLMGYDWSHPGVTHLFSAIKENGYKLLFLSARSISQSNLTRQFLVNLEQDGKALPEGPIVISPDGLFPSLYREVIRRAPHEFKISCLEDIKALFPPDHNPFYAGFGNRHTDELSYLRVGIPRGKIFTINPKGQVVVNRRVDTKSYTSLHTIVHDMFPPTTLHEQEDYNSWNFWRLPPPDVGM